MSNSKLSTLATNYRPQIFSEVRGSEENIAILEGMIKQESYKVINSIVVSGVSGGGKTTLARIFAKAINCLGDNKPCNECKHCKQFDQGSYQDYKEVDATSYSGKDDIPILQRLASLNPTVKGGTRIILLDESHALSAKANDMLLKTLEDAVNSTIWIFATTEMEKMATAMIGRSTVLKISPLGQEDIRLELERIIELEGIKTKEKLIKDIARVFRGQMRHAIAELDKYYKAFGKDLTKVNINVKSDEDVILEILLEALQNNVSSANVDIDRSLVTGDKINKAVVNILSASYLHQKKQKALYDFGAKEELVQTFLNCFNPKDFIKLLQQTINTPIDTTDKLKLLLLIVVELSKNKEEISLLDEVIKDSHTQDKSQRRGLRGQEKETIEEKTKPKRKKKKVKSKRKAVPPKNKDQILDLGFSEI